MTTWTRGAKNSRLVLPLPKWPALNPWNSACAAPNYAWSITLPISIVMLQIHTYAQLSLHRGRLLPTQPSRIDEKCPVYLNVLSSIVAFGTFLFKKWKKLLYRRLWKACRPWFFGFQLFMHFGDYGFYDRNGKKLKSEKLGRHVFRNQLY